MLFPHPQPIRLTQPYRAAFPRRTASAYRLYAWVWAFPCKQAGDSIQGPMRMPPLPPGRGIEQTTSIRFRVANRLSRAALAAARERLDPSAKSPGFIRSTGTAQRCQPADRASAFAVRPARPVATPDALKAEQNPHPFRALPGLQHGPGSRSRLRGAEGEASRGLGPESVAPNRPCGPLFAIGCVLPTVAHCCAYGEREMQPSAS